MIFSYNWLQSFFTKKLPKPEKLAELLTLHFAEVEEVKKSGKDFTLDIDIRPNRAADCFSHFGVAREIAAILDLRLKTPDYKPKEDKKIKAKNFVNVSLVGKGPCLRYTAKVITDVKVGESPQWLKERLKSCGLRPINNIVDIANFVMLETGQPLHAFDGEKLQQNKILVRFAREGEKITTLDNQKFDLDSDILVIADAKSPVGIAGIKGGKIPEIDKSTRTVVLESANFDSRVIRRGSKKLNLRTDASLRFEHGVDPNLTEFAAQRAAFLIQKLAKGRLTNGSIDVYPKKTLTKKIILDTRYVNSLLGVEIPEETIKKILESLEFKVKKSKSKILNVTVPTFRMDVSLPEDLIEEVGRIYGLNKIPAIFPISSLIPPVKNLDIFWEGTAKKILKEAGLTESYNYSFISDKDKKIYMPENGNNNLIELENPLSEDSKYLRPSLIPNLIKNVQRNQKKFSRIRIFELGKIFTAKRGGYGEKRMLTSVVTGEEFFYLKGIVDILFNKMGISDVWYDDYKPTPEQSRFSLWQPKKCAEIKIGQEEIGFLGELSSEIARVLKISQKAVIFDLDFDKLSKLASEEHEFRPIPKYPSAVRDLAILVPLQVKVEEVLNIIETTGGTLVRDTDLFDIYEGEELPGGKKNLAFHIIYQSEDKTLSSEEIDEIHNKIIKALEKDPEWQVRK